MKKTEKNILMAFLLNLLFSIIELIGGFFTNSIAIISDSVHDFGDSLSIGISYFLEKKSKKKPDTNYTYGYVRYSVLGSIITNIILFCGSILVIYNAVIRLFEPVPINYNGMIIFAIFGVVINSLSLYLTREGESLNQKAVNLHMLEDVLGWLVVLIGAIIMRFTDIRIIDSILSIGVAVFILIHVIKSLKKIMDIFLEKSPDNIDIEKIKKHLLEINGVIGVHHIHVRSIDGYHNYATMHIVCENDFRNIKHKIKHELEHLNIQHSTIELESKDEKCDNKDCEVKVSGHSHHHH